MKSKKRLVYNPFKKAYWTKDNLIRPHRQQQKDAKHGRQKQIKETKCICVACENIWFYGKEDVTEQRAKAFENTGNELSNAGKSMMCCSGCVPALLIPDKRIHKIRDLDECPQCGSKAVEKEVVIHHVK